MKMPQTFFLTLRATIIVYRIYKKPWAISYINKPWATIIVYQIEDNQRKKGKAQRCQEDRFHEDWEHWERQVRQGEVRRKGEQERKRTCEPTKRRSAVLRGAPAPVRAAGGGDTNLHISNACKSHACMSLEKHGNLSFTDIAIWTFQDLGTLTFKSVKMHWGISFLLLSSLWHGPVEPG